MAQVYKELGHPIRLKTILGQLYQCSTRGYCILFDLSFGVDTSGFDIWWPQRAHAIENMYNTSNFFTWVGKEKWVVPLVGNSRNLPCRKNKWKNRNSKTSSPPPQSSIKIFLMTIMKDKLRCATLRSISNAAPVSNYLQEAIAQE